MGTISGLALIQMCTEVLPRSEFNTVVARDSSQLISCSISNCESPSIPHKSWSSSCGHPIPAQPPDMFQAPAPTLLSNCPDGQSFLYVINLISITEGEKDCRKRINKELHRHHLPMHRIASSVVARYAYLPVNVHQASESESGRSQSCNMSINSNQAEKQSPSGLMSGKLTAVDSPGTRRDSQHMT